MYLQGVTPECFNEAELREWIRNPPAMKPMYAEPSEEGPRTAASTAACRTSTSPTTRSTRSSPTCSSGSKEDHRWPSSNDPPQFPPSPAQMHRSSSRPASSYGVFRRPVTTTGWRSWVFTVDHKKLGIMYGVVGDVLLPRRWHRGAAHPPAVGGARQHRAQRRPVQRDVHDARHDHGVPVRDADGGGVRQLLPAAADRRPRRRVPAHQRASASGCFLFGGIFLNSSWFLGGAADGGWFMYSPNASALFSPSHGVDFWVARSADHRYRLARRCHQPDRHRPQHACPGHDADAACRSSPG